jgi:hypothetical protein
VVERGIFHPSSQATVHGYLSNELSIIAGDYSYESSAKRAVHWCTALKFFND